MKEKQFKNWLQNYPIKLNNNQKKNILKLLNNVSKITEKPAVSILKGIDFNPSDKSIEKLEAILAELRAVAFLKNNTFQKITLLSSKKKQSYPDMIAERDGQKFVIEVACLTKKHSRKKISKLDVYEFDDNKFVNTLKSIAKRKKEQLDVIESKKKMLVFIINRSPDLELYNLNEYKNILKNLVSELEWNSKKYYFAVVTGCEINGELCDLIYPAL